MTTELGQKKSQKNRRFSEINLDFDGLLGDFCLAALSAHGVCFTDRLEWPSPGKDLCHVLGIPYVDGWKHRFWGPIQTIPDFWLTVEPFPWIDELLELCFQATGSTHGVKVLSSPASCFKGEDIKQKMRWLARYNVNLEVRFEDAKHKYSRPGALLIDDWEKQVDDWLEKPAIGQRGEALLFPQPWNRDHALAVDPMERVRNFFK